MADYIIAGTILNPTDSNLEAYNTNIITVTAESAPLFDADWLGGGRFIIHYSYEEIAGKQQRLAILEWNETANVVTVVGEYNTTSLFENPYVADDTAANDGEFVAITALSPTTALMIYPSVSGGVKNMFTARVVHVTANVITLGVANTMLGTFTNGVPAQEGYFPAYRRSYTPFAEGPVRLKSYNQNNAGVFFRYDRLLPPGASDTPVQEFWSANLSVDGDVVTASTLTEVFPDRSGYSDNETGYWTNTRIHWDLIPGSSGFLAGVTYLSGIDYTSYQTDVRTVEMPGVFLGPVTELIDSELTPAFNIWSTMLGTDHIVIYPEATS